MIFEREKYPISFSIKNFPDWNCPTCGKGKLNVITNSIKSNELIESKKKNKNYPPQAIPPSKNTFFFEAICSQTTCLEQIYITGKMEIEETEDWVPELEELVSKMDKVFYPEYFYPTLKLFKCPDYYTPYDVEDALEIAFKLFWLDKAACVNACRKTIEEILNDKKINKTNKKKTPKRKYLSLHERLELYKKKNFIVADYLIASKWIGNSGSHQSDIDNEVALDCLEILFHALQMLYNPDYDRIPKLIKQVNKVRGPVR